MLCFNGILFLGNRLFSSIQMDSPGCQIVGWEKRGSISISAAISRRVKQMEVNDERPKQIIKKSFTDAEDSEVSTTSLKASLICPIGKSRLVTPCRGEHCTHVQCMDVVTVLGLIMHRPTAKCPLCDKPVKMTTIYIDALFQQILTAVPEVVTDVTFAMDGSWSYTGEENNGGQSVGKSLNRSIIDLTATDDEVTPIKKTMLVSYARCQQPSNCHPSKQKDAGVKRRLRAPDLNKGKENVYSKKSLEKRRERNRRNTNKPYSRQDDLFSIRGDDHHGGSRDYNRKYTTKSNERRTNQYFASVKSDESWSNSYKGSYFDTDYAYESCSQHFRGDRDYYTRSVCYDDYDNEFPSYSSRSSFRSTYTAASERLHLRYFPGDRYDNPQCYNEGSYRRRNHNQLPDDLYDYNAYY
ncbi:uncharacterized protein LOC127871421 isoform X2 [Dreissena polymorpha]|uniref:uncharacterized protein LOC127871421 isoform X2 n=1 Tax=Dreissena polymorpha TaxID=45954 RepID=UPI002263F41F|nr:uncharacterized protein LOC127871421 isoform X2 [Dreissena polymorpha]